MAREMKRNLLACWRLSSQPLVWLRWPCGFSASTARPPSDLHSAPVEILPGRHLSGSPRRTPAHPGGTSSPLSVLVWVAGINAAGHVLIATHPRVCSTARGGCTTAGAPSAVSFSSRTLWTIAQLFGSRTLAISDSLTGLQISISWDSCKMNWKDRGNQPSFPFC